MKILFRDKPAGFPEHCPDGSPMKALTQALLDRRDTTRFKPNPVPDEYLEAILEFGAQAPSGYNLQPWRFVVVRDKENRERLKKAAYNQEKVAEAPVVIVAFGLRGDWRNYMNAIFQEGVRRGVGKPEMLPEMKNRASDFLENGIPQSIWLNRHTTIAVTTMMLVAETYGLDTAPLEGFDPEAVKRRASFAGKRRSNLPARHRVCKRTGQAIRRRLALEEFVYNERYGQRWNGKNNGGPGRNMSEKIDRKAKETLQPA